MNNLSLFNCMFDELHSHIWLPKWRVYALSWLKFGVYVELLARPCNCLRESVSFTETVRCWKMKNTSSTLLSCMETDNKQEVEKEFSSHIVLQFSSQSLKLPQGLREFHSHGRTFQYFWIANCKSSLLCCHILRCLGAIWAFQPWGSCQIFALRR